VPQDYACVALLDDPDPNAVQVLKTFRWMAIPDALKLSKDAVGYAKGELQRIVRCVRTGKTARRKL
jgi:hypothetical protein